MVYIRVNRWVKKGVRQAAFPYLQLGIIQIKVNKVHLDDIGSKKMALSLLNNTRQMEH